MRRIAPALLAASLLAACGQDAPRGNPLTGEGAPPAGSPHGAAPAQPALPPGHPPMDAPPQPAPPIGRPAPQTGAAFTWTAPPGWKESPPANIMRLAQFELPVKGADGTNALLLVFGPMGGKDANIGRWVGQITQPDGSSTRDRAKITEEKREGFVLTRIEIPGTYNAQMVPGQGDVVAQPNSTFLAAIVEVEGDPSKALIVKIAGPSAAIDPEIPNFDALLASIHRR